MLKEYFLKTNVLKFIKEIKTNERYYSKKSSLSINSFICISNDAALYIFYEALYKYKVIINDDKLFDEYIEQVEKLYRKLDSFENIKYGINKLICKMLIIKFNIKDVELERERIIKEIYDKYIRNGYYIHGFHSSYIDDINKDGFNPEIYENYYDRFSKINDIFEKYDLGSIITKNFNEKKVYFTDDFVMGCFYSNYAPLFYYKFLLNEEAFGNRIRKDNCLICDYSTLIRHLKRFMNNNSFSEDDKKYILDVVLDEWNLLHRSDNKISLLLVKRDIVFSKNVNLDDYLRDKKDIYEVVDRMLSSKYNNLEYDKYISKDNFEIIELDSYYDVDEDIDKKEEKVINKINSDNTSNSGNVSIFIILGSLFISLGVIITIISILRG